MRHFEIVLTCEKGHTQKIGYYGVSREFCQTVAMFMDGSYAQFKRPGSGAEVGKCVTCGTQFKAVVTEVQSDAEEDCKQEENGNRHQPADQCHAAGKPCDGEIPHQ